jgi:hypothetical protein
MNKKISAALIVLSIVTLACGINFQLPTIQVKTGPTVEEEIQIPFLDNPDDVAVVTLEFGAGELNLEPGAEDYLIDGVVTYNVEDFKPQIDIDGNEVKIEQGDLDINGIPDFRGNIKNEWDFKLSDSPMDLTVNAGAYSANFEFGGLALTELEIKDGASSVDLEFSEPNLADMDTLEYITGASEVSMYGLANANFDDMVFRSGAGSYRLEFDGDLKRDADVSIDSGVSSITLVFPEGTNVELRFTGGLTNLETRGNWDRSGNLYTLEGDGPTLYIDVNMGAGNLVLRED